MIILQVKIPPNLHLEFHTFLLQKRQVGDEKAERVSRISSAHAAVYSTLMW